MTTALDHARDVAAALASELHTPMHVVMDGTHPIVVTDAAIGHWPQESIVYTVEPGSVYDTEPSFASRFIAPMFDESDILTDCLAVITMTLGHARGAASIVEELRRIKARLEEAV